MYSALSIITKHFPLSAGRMINVSSFCSCFIAVRSPFVMLLFGRFAFFSSSAISAFIAAAAPGWICLPASSVAIMNSSVGMVCGVIANPAPFCSSLSCSSVIVLEDMFFTHLSFMLFPSSPLSSLVPGSCGVVFSSISSSCSVCVSVTSPSALSRSSSFLLALLVLVCLVTSCWYFFFWLSLVLLKVCISLCLLLRCMVSYIVCGRVFRRLVSIVFNCLSMRLISVTMFDTLTLRSALSALRITALDASSLLLYNIRMLFGMISVCLHCKLNLK